jgi:hypothetical protein
MALNFGSPSDWSSGLIIDSLVAPVRKAASYHRPLGYLSIGILIIVDA